MPQLMSVAMTEQAVVNRTKTVTRRRGWWTNKHGRQLLAPGDRLTLCRKVMGRKKGEPLVRLTEVEAIHVRRERLDLLITYPDYGAAEVAREGFPGMDPAEFVRRFFTDAQGIQPEDHVTRIEWRYLDHVHEWLEAESALAGNFRFCRSCDREEWSDGTVREGRVS
jgi:hypothetical protein